MIIKAWNEGPYLSAPANKKDIDRSYPYCMRSSIYMQKIAELVVDNKFNETGKPLCLYLQLNHINLE